MREIPFWEKMNLTLEEAAAYSGIGIHKLRSLTDSEDCDFVLWNGAKIRRLFIASTIIQPYLSDQTGFPCIDGKSIFDIGFSLCMTCF